MNTQIPLLVLLHIYTLLIGSNDFPNFSTSLLASRSLSYQNWIYYLGIFEILGFLISILKYNVVSVTGSNDVRNVIGIAISIAWVGICSILGLPISTSHTITTSIAGMNRKGYVLGKLGLSLVTSILISVFVSVFLAWISGYLLCRLNSLQVILFSLPFLFPLVLITLLTLILTSISSLSMLTYIICYIVATVLGILLGFLLQNLYENRLVKEQRSSWKDWLYLQNQNARNDGLHTYLLRFKPPTEPDPISLSDLQSPIQSDDVQITEETWIQKIINGITTKRIRHYDLKCEMIHISLMHLSCSAMALTHGLTDSKNTMQFLTGTAPDFSLYVLATSLGLATVLGFFASNPVHQTLAHLTLYTPTRAFHIQFTTILSILISSLLSLKVSTTLCVVSTMVGTGLLEGTVNWSIFRRCCIGWILTLFIPFLVSYAVSFIPM